MSSLAAFALSDGHKVSGSDRSHDQGKFPEKFEKLKNIGMKIFPQNGVGVTDTVDFFVTSTAVEKHIPDVKAALGKNVKILRRAEYLAQLINDNVGVTIAGTSGKSTVTAMAGHIFYECDANPNVLNGAVLLNNYKDSQLGLGNTIVGESNVFIAEACESDGTIVNYEPTIALLHNVTLDHKNMDELLTIFDRYLSNAKQRILLNIDDQECINYNNKYKNAFTYSIEKEVADLYASDITPTENGVAFNVHYKNEAARVTLCVAGRHNVSNALGAISCAINYGLGFKKSIYALETFQGIKSRMEYKGKSSSGITVIDDYAHNPDKIAATLSTLNEHDGRAIIMYQPHGYGPTQMLKDGYIETFRQNLRDNDILILSEIFYAGGTAEKTISSQDLVEEIRTFHSKTYYGQDLPKSIERIRNMAQSGDRVVIMGARDDTLRDVSSQLVTQL